MRSINRRQVLAGVAGVTAATVVGRQFAFAQEDAPPVLEATPVVSGLEVGFPVGALPTIYGDIEIPANVGKIVTLTDGALDAAITVGVQPVGVTRSSNGESAAGYLLDQVMPEVVYVGGWSELDLELIVTLAPDVILADRYLPPDQYEMLSQVAPTFATGEISVALDDAAGLQQWEYEQLAWGHVLGKTPEATIAIEEARSRAAGIAASLGDVAGNAVVVFRPQPDFPVVMSHAWISGRVLTWSGLVGNDLTTDLPPPHSGRDISLEQLDLLDADWLFAATRDQEQTDALEAYKAMPLFQQIAASASDQVIAVDGALWSGATGIIASHAMMDDIEAILVNGER
jgi:iron complex transport system substrate-binding protein